MVGSCHLPLQTHPLSSSTTLWAWRAELWRTASTLAHSLTFGQVWPMGMVERGASGQGTDSLAVSLCSQWTAMSFDWRSQLLQGTNFNITIFLGVGNIPSSFLFRYRDQPLPTPFMGPYILIILYILVSSLFLECSSNYGVLPPASHQVPGQPPPEPVRIQCLCGRSQWQGGSTLGFGDLSCSLVVVLL